MSNREIASYGLLMFITLSYNINLTVSLVECPGKEVKEIRLQAEQHEVSFMFYHVSWSNNSQTARLMYEQIAQDYREQFYFAIIDCYHLACNCSRTHPLSIGSGSPSKWPTLVIRYGHRILLHYNGEWSVRAINRFIGSLLMPVERLHTRDELKELRMYRDAVVLGAFDNELQKEYRTFVSASVKWLETDPEYSFRFATAFGIAAEDVLCTTNNTANPMPQLLLITNNGIDVMPSEWHVSKIVLWLQTEFMKSLNNLHSYDSPKSLAIHLQLSPAMVVIANTYFFEYMYNLTNPGTAINSTCTTITWNRKIIDLQELEYVKYTLKKQQVLNPLQCYTKEILSIFNLRYYYALNKYLSKLFCDLSHNCVIDKSNFVLKDNLGNKCSRELRFTSPTNKILAAKYLKKFVDSNWQEFKYTQNQSLAVVILDETNHLDFLQNLGIQAIQVEDSVTMIIADRLKESMFVSQDVFTYNSLQEFVRSYYNNSLLAYKRHVKLKTKLPLSHNYLLIENVNREIFLKKIEKTNSTTIMLLYSPECMFSAYASQALIQLSAMLDDSSGIQIIRLNTLFDELPWEFKMANTPTLLVFPRGRSSDSRIFPMHMHINVRNVFSFVLAQMEPIDKLKALLSCCRRRKLYSHRMRNCLQFIRTLVDQYTLDTKGKQNLNENNIMQEQMLAELNDINLALKTICPFY